MNKQIKRLFAVILTAFLLLLLSCGDTPDNPAPEEKYPVLLSSVPAENAEVSPATEQIILVFDSKIVLIDKTQVRLNGQQVKQAKASNDSLYVQLDRLDAATAYNLVIEKNTIKANPGGFNPEPFSLSFSTGFLPPVTYADLAVKNPSPEIQRLYNFLKTNYGQKIISGTVANVSWNTNEAQWVYQHTGKYPALNCFDYIFLFASPANWIDYSQTQVVEDWAAAGGIVSCMWHWNVPKRSGSADYSFYTTETDFDINKALTEGTEENRIIKADLDKVADYLILLKNKNIPILWRPLHEAKGNIGKYAGGEAWFWWGKGGAEAFKSLWQLMFKTFEAKGINNLIWVWTSESGDKDWYPGDGYVDIIGRDMYNLNSAAGMLAEYNNLKADYPNRLITLSECGNVTAIPDQWNAGAQWSWFMTWYDYERTVDPGSDAFKSEEHQHGNADFWRKAFADEQVLSRDEISF